MCSGCRSKSRACQRASEAIGQRFSSKISAGVFFSHLSGLFARLWESVGCRPTCASHVGTFATGCTPGGVGAACPHVLPPCYIGPPQPLTCRARRLAAVVTVVGHGNEVSGARLTRGLHMFIYPSWLHMQDPAGRAPGHRICVCLQTGIAPSPRCKRMQAPDVCRLLRIGRRHKSYGAVVERGHLVATLTKHLARATRSAASAELQTAAAEGQFAFVRLAPPQKRQQIAAQVPAHFGLDTRGMYDAPACSESSRLGLNDQHPRTEALGLNHRLVESRCDLCRTHSTTQPADCLTKGFRRSSKTLRAAETTWMALTLGRRSGVCGWR